MNTLLHSKGVYNAKGEEMRVKKQDAIAGAITVLLAITFIAAILMWGCAAHVPSSPSAPGRAGTPVENALAYNAALAQSNLAIAHLVINANNQTPPMIPTDAANRILMAQSRIADLDRQLTPLLANASLITGSSAQIAQLLAEIQGAAAPLVTGGELGIKDANTQQAVLAATNGVLSSAGLILQTLQAGGLLK